MIEEIVVTAIGLVAVLAFGVLIYRAGVRQGMLMAKMAWNIQNEDNPLDDIEPAPKDTSPDAGECD